MVEDFSVKNLAALDSSRAMFHQAGLVLRDLADTPTAVGIRHIDFTAHVPESYIDLLYPLVDVDLDDVLTAFVRRIEKFGVAVAAHENVFGSEAFHQFEKCLTFASDAKLVANAYMPVADSSDHPVVAAFRASIVSQRLALDQQQLSDVFDLFLTCKPSWLSAPQAPQYYPPNNLSLAKNLYQFVFYCVDMFA